MTDQNVAGYEPTHEARFAIVMYGGVSLAIYINGVAQELHRLVAATAPDATGTALYLPDDKLESSQLAYREIARRHQPGGGWAGGVVSGAPIACRFVVDILSGTSAGGINAVFLAKALAEGLPFDALKTMWVEQADITKLWNTRDPPSSERDLPGSESGLPESVLSGPTLYEVALAALDEMDTSRPCDPGPVYAEQVDLAVTSTDLQGLWLPIQMADEVVQEPRHRVVFRFVHATAAATGHEHFGFRGRNRMLAFAARATSSFPVAFEPVRAGDLPDSDSFSEWFGDYVRAGVADWQKWAFADGGFLDNKPFTAATAELRRRRADTPVDRALLYIEPDPEIEQAGEHRAPRARPNAQAVALDGVSLPRKEPIRGDIAALAHRNAQIERLRSVIREASITAMGEDPPVEVSPAVRVGYLQLRRVQLIGDLTTVVLAAANRPAGGHTERFVGLILDAWLPTTSSELDQALGKLDLAYRLRCLVLLQDRLSELLVGDGTTLGLVVMPSPGERQWLRGVKQELNDISVTLRACGRLTRGTERGETAPTAGRDDDPLAAALAPFQIGAPDSLDIPSVLTADDPPAAAATLIEEKQGVFDALGAVLTERFASLFADCESGTSTALASEGGGALASVLLRYKERLPLVDTVSFPLGYPELGDTNPVAIYRVSPRDARGAVADRKWGPHDRPLAGARVHHFGAFLDESWRRHDILFGRLDGAERIVTALVPDVGGDRKRLLVQAHAGILREEFCQRTSLAGVVESLRFLELCALERPVEPAAAQAADTELVTLFRDAYRPPADLPRERRHALEEKATLLATEVFVPILGEDVHQLIGVIWKRLTAKATADKHRLLGFVRRVMHKS